MSSFSAFTATTAYAQMLPANLSRAALMLKAPKGNTDTVFYQLVQGGVSGTTANMMPLEAGESILIGAEYGQLRASELASTIYAQSNTGSQNIRYIEF